MGAQESSVGKGLVFFIEVNQEEIRKCDLEGGGWGGEGGFTWQKINRA